MSKKMKSKSNKFRNPHKQGAFSYWLYGKHAVLAAVNNPSRNVTRTVATSNAARDINLPTAPEIVDSTVIEKLVPDGAIHQGVACNVEPLEALSLQDVTDKKLLVVLDQVTDPHNIGAILRSSAAFGAGAVILPKDNAPSENAIIAKSASGALDIVPMVQVTNLATSLKELKEEDYWVIGLDGYAKDTIKTIPDYEKMVLILGAEGKGMRKLTKECCDLLVSLPISGDIESLNVSNAAAVALYEISS